MVTNTMNNGLTIFPVVKQLRSTIEKAACFLHPKELPSDGLSQEDESDVPAVCFSLCVTEGKSFDISVMQFPYPWKQNSCSHGEILRMQVLQNAL